MADKLTIFGDSSSISETGEINVVTEDNVTLDNIVDGLSDIKRELMLTRKGTEQMDWEKQVEDMELDMDDVPEERNKLVED